MTDHVVVLLFSSVSCAVGIFVNLGYYDVYEEGSEYMCGNLIKSILVDQ